jgi:hypothetical protein
LTEAYFWRLEKTVSQSSPREISGELRRFESGIGPRFNGACPNSPAAAIITKNLSSESEFKSRRITRKISARRQFHAAIKLFHEDEYESTITLALAAESQLPHVAPYAYDWLKARVLIKSIGLTTSETGSSYQATRRD